MLIPMTNDTENGVSESDNNAGTIERTAEDAAIRQARHPMEILLKGGLGSAMQKAGDIVEGVVLDKKGTRLFVDLGSQGIGLVYGREYHSAQDIIKD
jgi:hypothetical protein